MRDQSSIWKSLFAFLKFGSLFLLIIGLNACKRVPPHPVITEAFISPDPIVGEIVTLHIEAVSGKDEHDATIDILLPEEINLVAGDLGWHGYLTANQPKVHEVSICVLRPGENWHIFIGASSQLSATSSTGDMEILNIESTLSSAHVIRSADYRVTGPGNPATAILEVQNATLTPIPPTVSAECSGVQE